MDSSYTREDSAAKLHDALALLLEVLKSRVLTAEVPEELTQLPAFMELRETLIDFREFLLAVSAEPFPFSRAKGVPCRSTEISSLRLAASDLANKGDFLGRLQPAGRFHGRVFRIVQPDGSTTR